MYIDVIPDTTELTSFREQYGFTPPAEPLLQPVFEHGEGVSVSKFTSWDVPADVVIPVSEILAAMKVRSLPDRETSHKRVKDAADLHALLWYTKAYSEMKVGVLQHVTTDDISRLEAATDEELCDDAAQLLRIDSTLVSGSIQRLFH